MKTTKEFLEKIEHHEKMKKRGFTFSNCKFCNGTRDTKARYDRESCPVCRGEGGKWTAPLVC